MKRKHIGPIIFVVIVTVGICVALLLVSVMYSLKQTGTPLGLLSEPPSVQILMPEDGTVITSGQGLMVIVEANSEVGLARIDFLVDGTLEQQHIPISPGETSLQTVFPWFGSSTGWHQLSAVSYDLQGRASEATSVQVGVQASAGLPEVGQVSEEGAMPGEGDAAPAEGEAPVADEQAPQEDAPIPPEAGEQPEGDADAPVDGDVPLEDAAPPQAEADAPAAEDPIPPEGDQIPPELPPQPQDAPPDITRFDMFVDIFDNPQGDVWVVAVAVGSASDDLGLQRLTLSWQSDAGHEGDFSVECVGERACELELSDRLLPGRWVFSLQAFDTSGQASQPDIEIVEVLGEPDQPPAAAEHEIDEDWLREHFADQNDFDIAAPNLPFGPGFDVDEFLEEMFPGRQAAPEEADAAQAEGLCVSMSVEPRGDGNLVTMRIECDLEIEEEGRFLLLSSDKYLVNMGDGGINLFVREWYDNTRTSVSVGDTFTWLDWDVTCGTPYRYAVRISSGKETDIGLSMGAMLAFAQADAITTPACAPGSIGDVNLRVDAHPEGALIRWDIAGGRDWPEDLPDEGVAFILTRFDPISEQAERIYHENVPADLLLAGGEFEVLDDSAQCGSEYWYTLAAIAANADLDLVSPGWLLRAQTRGPEIPCPADDLGSIEMILTPYWFNESIIRIRIQTFLPAGFAWPQGDDVKLEILRIRQGVDHCEGPPCRGIWQAKKRIPINDEIRLNGLAYEDDDTSVDFRWSETYVYRLALVVDGEEVQNGMNISATTPPAPPPPPEIMRLTATNNCPGGTPRCMVIEWQAYQQPRQNGYYAQAASIAVERVIGALDRQLFPVNLVDTRYVDLNPFMQEWQMANGQVDRNCRYDVTYRMVAFDAEGHTYGASGLSMITPQCDEAWNKVVEPR